MSGAVQDDTSQVTNEPPERDADVVSAETAAATPESGPDSGDDDGHASNVMPFPRAPARPVMQVGLEPAPPVEPPPPRRIGDEIRDTRIAKGFDLESLARDTKIGISFLRAIEDMQVKRLPESPVYRRGHIRVYAQALGMDPVEVLRQFEEQCAALGDAPVAAPVRPAAPPPSSRRIPPLAIAGVAGVVAIGAIGAFMLKGGERAPEAETSQSAKPATAETAAAAPAGPAPTFAAPPLRLVALQRAWVEIRSADGTTMTSRYLEPGESYPPRVGANWTVTAQDGAAFEWRVGDSSLGLLAAEGGPVYAQSVDQVLSREAVILPPQAAPVVPATGAPPAAGPTVAGSAGAPGQATAPAKPRPRPRPEGETVLPPKVGAAAPSAPAADVTPPPVINVGPADMVEDLPPAPPAQ